MNIRLGDVVGLRKSHPCGSFQWQVERVGADFRLRCLGCGRLIMMERSMLERRLRGIISSTETDQAEYE